NYYISTNLFIFFEILTQKISIFPLKQTSILLSLLNLPSNSFENRHLGFLFSRFVVVGFVFAGFIDAGYVFTSSYSPDSSCRGFVFPVVHGFSPPSMIVGYLFNSKRMCVKMEDVSPNRQDDDLAEIDILRTGGGIHVIEYYININI
ncbi:hypothetical protein V2J09_020805, partial [Rumex salicifolius]